jgi:crossover junction endodeoxyribonuclease RuvC
VATPPAALPAIVETIAWTKAGSSSDASATLSNVRSSNHDKAPTVLGLDPGVAVTGVAVVERAGGLLRLVVADAIRTSAELPQARRLARLRVELAALMSLHRPAVVAVERLFFNANAKTAMSVGQASGVALACAAETGAEVIDYTPLEVKQSVVGFGGADKRQVGRMVAAMLKLEAPPRPPDAADACALAICHLNRMGLTRAVQAAR